MTRNFIDVGLLAMSRSCADFDIVSLWEKGSEFLFIFPPKAFSPTVEAKDEETETSSKLNIIALASAVVGIVPIAVVILIIAIVTKRRGKVVSIKNRVQVEKHRASEEDKIASLFKPDDVKQIPLTRIEYIRDLGSWNFGSVFLGTYIYREKGVRRSLEGSRGCQGN